MNKYAVLAGLVITILVVGLFGYHFGYSVDGVPQREEVPDESPGILAVVDYVFGSLGFLFSMVAFRIDGMPSWISSVFIFMSLMAFAILISLIRGTE